MCYLTHFVDDWLEMSCPSHVRRCIVARNLYMYHVLREIAHTWYLLLPLPENGVCEEALS